MFSALNLLTTSCNMRTGRQDTDIEISVVKVFLEDTINFTKASFVVNVKNKSDDDKALFFNKRMNKEEQESDNNFNAKLILHDGSIKSLDMKLLNYFPDMIWVKSNQSQNLFLGIQTNQDSSFYRRIGNFRDSTININSRLDFKLMLSRINRNDTVTGHFSGDAKIYNRPSFPFDLN